MEKVIATEKKPIKMWLSEIDDGTLLQAKNLANLPFIFKHIAIMPDAHQGYGMPIGGVMATQNVVIPNAVGVDIGCGMCAVKTFLTHLSKDTLKTIMGNHNEGIRGKIPVGRLHHLTEQKDWFSDKYKSKLCRGSIIEQEHKSSLKQIGTLGGGNHFIEIQKDYDGFIWLMIHSGSRNIGYKVADHYNKLAIRLNKKWNSIVPEKWELSFLPLDSDEGQNYLIEMQCCVDFAKANRRLMMSRVKESISDTVGDVKFDEMINIAHNYAALERHFKTNVMVHRKGATKAQKDQIGIIPGSQGTASYIVRGKGNPESFQSCSHGAGRKMSRKQAQRELDFNAEKKRLDDMGVIHAIRNKKDLDEAAGAYKDIGIVMKNQADLVDIVVKLKPLAVIKG